MVAVKAAAVDVGGGGGVGGGGVADVGGVAERRRAAAAARLDAAEPDQQSVATVPLRIFATPRLVQKNFREMLNPRYQSSLVEAAPRDLAERRAEAVREIQLEQVAAGALLDAEADVRRRPGRSR